MQKSSPMNTSNRPNHTREYQYSPTRRGGVALAAIGTLTVVLIITLGLLSVTGGAFMSSDQKKRATVLRAIADAGIEYGYWKKAWKGQTLPYTEGNLSCGSGTFSVSVQDYSATVTDSFQVSSTASYRGQTLTVTRVFPNYTVPFYSTGFTEAAQKLTVNGSATVVNNKLRLTNGLQNEYTTVFHNSSVPIDRFVTEFTFQIQDVLNTGADGFTFCFQGAGPDKQGSNGGGLGYGPDSHSGPLGIANSVAIKIDTWDNEGEGRSSTGLYTNGAAPTTPCYNLYNDNIDLHSGHIFKMKLAYKNKVMKVTVTDTQTNAVSKQSYNIDIPAYVGTNSGYIGFSASCGWASEIQDILTWTYSLSPSDSDFN